MIVLRDYQERAATQCVRFLRGVLKGGGVCILPTGSGKSVVIAEVVKQLQDKTIVLQPSKEILKQNFAKYRAYGFYASVYSASLGRKERSSVVFGTIGTIISKVEKFQDYKYILIDECHLVNAKKGMYEEFLKKMPQARVVGLTATPYRLASAGRGFSMLKFITRTRPKIFNHVIYYVQNKLLFDRGYLAKMQYFHVGGFDRTKIKLNSTGADYDERSLQQYYKAINLTGLIVKCVLRLIEIKRKNILVFVRFIYEAEQIAAKIPGAVVITGESKDRDKILADFTSGKIKVLINIGVLTTGFDYPELETIVLGRETMSLALYYQMIGRGIRIHPQKEFCMVVDCCGNYQLFGKVEDLTIKDDGRGKYYIASGDIQLTNVPLSKEKNIFTAETQQIQMSYAQHQRR